ncbi:MAG: hypothetical protein Q9183_003269 [Haloplaca sp. 2 TL-2023]
MIERAATCLKNGGRHLLRLRKNSFPKRRSLHSAFWSHGAGDIDLPEWWLAFLQVPVANTQLWETRQNSYAAFNLSSDGLGLGILEFLYPTRTLAFLRSYVTKDTTTWSLRRPAQNPAQGRRAYTSTADQPVLSRKSSGTKCRRSATQEVDIYGRDVRAQETILRETLQSLIYDETRTPDLSRLEMVYRDMRNLSVSIDSKDLVQLLDILKNSYPASEFTTLVQKEQQKQEVRVPQHELRMRFDNLLNAKDGPSLIRELLQVFKQLQDSPITPNAEDITRLFELFARSTENFALQETQNFFDAIPKKKQQASHYDHAIAAAVKRNDLGSAMAMNDECTLRFGTTDGSLLILEHTINNSRWSDAAHVWQLLTSTKRQSSMPEELGLGHVLKDMPLPEQFEKAIASIAYALQRIKADGTAKADKACRLAQSLASAALKTHPTDLDADLQSRLVERIFTLQGTLGCSPASFVRDAILQNLSVAQFKTSPAHDALAMQMYRKFRKDVNFVPSEELLSSLLKRSDLISNRGDLNMIYHDCQVHGISMSPRDLLVFASNFARHGDLDMVIKVSKEAPYTDRRSHARHYANHLLTACFRRADLSRAVQIFDSLGEEFGHQPSVVNWNTLLATYSRVRDKEGAMARFDSLIDAGVRPDSSTYAILMTMFARGSDYQATQMLYERAMSESVELSFEMVDALVLAQTTNNRAREAEQTLEETLELDLKASRRPELFVEGDQSRTRMWNTLLGHYAMIGHLDKVAALQKRMYSAKIAFNSATYGCLISAFCIKNKPEVAMKILKKVMPDARIRPTELHYAIIMSSFLAQNNVASVFHLAKHMKRAGVKRAVSTQNALIRASALNDERIVPDSLGEEAEFTATRAEKALNRTLDQLDPTQLASLGPTMYSGSAPNVALYASYFPFMIALYGRHKRFDKVTEMYNKFLSTSREFDPEGKDPAPTMMLSSLMTAYHEAGEHEETDKCWNLALQQAKKTACASNADTSRPGWVLHKHRHLLALHLNTHMMSLAARARVDDIATVIESLQEAGYSLATLNWNKYVQVLTQGDRALKAYEICEQKLMDGWPGWDQMGSKNHLKRKFYGTMSVKNWEKERPFPDYETLVYLASAYLDVQAMPYGRGKSLLHDFERVGPRAIEAVVRMPRFQHDELQARLLSRE